MSKKTSYLLGILLTIIIGTILYWFFCCKPCLEAKNAAIEAEKMEALEIRILNALGVKNPYESGNFVS